MKKELKNTKKKNNKGFSLVELIVVIAIMAVLMAVLAPTMLRYVEKSRIQKDRSAVSEVINAVNNALADETVNDAVKASDSIKVSDGKIEAGTAAATAGETALITEVTKTIKADSFKLSSKKYKTDSYTIGVEVGADGSSFQAVAYNNSHWTTDKTN